MSVLAVASMRSDRAVAEFRQQDCGPQGNWSRFNGAATARSRN